MSGSQGPLRSIYHVSGVPAIRAIPAGVLSLTLLIVAFALVLMAKSGHDPTAVASTLLSWLAIGVLVGDYVRRRRIAIRHLRDGMEVTATITTVSERGEGAAKARYAYEALGRSWTGTYDTYGKPATGSGLDIVVDPADPSVSGQLRAKPSDGPQWRKVFVSLAGFLAICGAIGLAGMAFESWRWPRTAHDGLTDAAVVQIMAHNIDALGDIAAGVHHTDDGSLDVTVLAGHLIVLVDDQVSDYEALCRAVADA